MVNYFYRLGGAALIGATLVGCEDTDGPIDLRCQQRTSLTFQPAIARDGEYRITVVGGGLDVTCTGRIVDGKRDDVRCVGVEGVGGPSVVYGGQTVVHEGNQARASEANEVAGLEWYRLGSPAQVTVEKDGQTIADSHVTFRAVTPPSECPEAVGKNVSGTIDLE